MRKLLKFSWARALGSAALLAGAAVVFVVLILPAAAFGKRAKKVACAAPPSNFDFSPTKGRPGKEVFLTGQNVDNVEDVYFKDAQGGLDEATVDVISSTVIRTHVPSGAVSGKIAVTVLEVGASTQCGPLVYSRRSFNVK